MGWGAAAASATDCLMAKWFTRGTTMKKAIALIGLAGLVAAAALATSERPAHAVIYCKYVGYPKGCVARAGVVLAPAPAVVVAPAPVVYCKYVGVPKGCVARAGVVLAPAPVVRRRAVGVGVNRGGPVNRIGVR